MRRDKFWLIIFGLISVVYIFLRVWHFTDSCLWFDEIFSVHAAEHNWRDLFWFVAQDLIHPPLFYILLKIWISVGGESLFRLRFFPVIFSAFSLIPFILLCRQIKLSNPAIAVALVFFAANGSLIKYAQEVRMYSILLCFALFSMWLFWRLINSGRGFLFLTGVNILLVYTHYFGWLIVAAEVLAAAILAREKLKRILLMFFVSLLSFSPWIFAVFQASKINSDIGQNIGWMAKPNVGAVFKFVFDLFEPVYFEQSNTDEPTIFLVTLPLFLLSIIVLGFYFAGWKDESKIEKRNFFLLAIFTFAPLLLAFAASWMTPFSIWGTRHLIIVFAPFAILLADAFSKIKVAPLKIAGFTIIFLLFAAAFLLQATRAKPKYIWCAWENLAADLPQNQSDLQTKNSGEPTKIYVFEDLVAYHFWFALRNSNEQYKIVKINGIEGLTEDKAYFLPRGFSDVETTNDFAGERFFVAFRASVWNENAPPLHNLIAQGYKIGKPQIFEAQGVKAFLVEVWK